MKLSELRNNPDNPRYITASEFEKLVKSIKEFPEMLKYRPIIYDNHNVIICGNMRYRALVELGYKEIPDEWAVCADDLTSDQVKRFLIVDNLNFGAWNMEMLSNEWNEQELVDWGMELPTEMPSYEQEVKRCPHCGKEIQ